MDETVGHREGALSVARVEALALLRTIAGIQDDSRSLGGAHRVVSAAVVWRAEVRVALFRHFARFDETFCHDGGAFSVAPVAALVLGTLPGIQDDSGSPVGRNGPGRAHCIASAAAVRGAFVRAGHL